MEFIIQGQRTYGVHSIERIPTPGLLVFEDRVRENFQRMREFLESVSPGSGFHHLCAHVKTHKSIHIMNQMRMVGIHSLKTTLNELPWVLRSGCRDVFLAYPLLEKDARWVADACRQYPESRVSVHAGSRVHMEILRRVAQERNIRWRVFLDLDVGMHRTGASPETASSLIRELEQGSMFDFMGLHGYDGHNHGPTESARTRQSRRSMKVLIQVFHECAAAGIPVRRVIAAGSPSFLTDLRLLKRDLPSEVHVQVSPGTWVYWDSGYDTLWPGAFCLAALILARVIDKGPGSRVTLNLGHKRWGADQGPLERFSHPGMRVVSFNEEHMVTVLEKGPGLQVGDYVCAVPRHICPTVNLYERAWLIDEQGRIGRVMPVDARNR
ncbi:MAG TPA: hypothetical protein ENN03_04450 [bacterium]|nr:hypothetical protein [bacterium]